MFSELAIFFYSIVYIPQFLLIWKEKSSNGVSLLTIVLWTQADFISLTASILLQLNKKIIIVDWYHCFISVLMTTICIHFNKQAIVLYKLAYGICFLNTLFCSVLQIANYQNENVGETLAWITSSIYIFGRFPQIYKNWKLRSTQGLSIWMFIFTMLGNGFYLFSIFEQSQSNISIYIPWITLILVSIVLDTIVLIQYWHHSIDDDDDDDDDDNDNDYDLESLPLENTE
jgi:uncharacterized protein with PQ loop repeat